MRGVHAIVPIGQRFGRLLVVAEVERTKHGVRVRCSCECGSEKILFLSHLKGGQLVSCGCFNRKRTIATNKARSTHGLTHSRAFRIWEGMKARCLNSRHTHFKSYGGRGITVCEEWMNSFQMFYQDMGKPPDGTTLDRIDNDGNYEPGNCRWATQEEQHNNKRTSRFLEADGHILTLTQWSRRTGINRVTLYGRLKRGWTTERALHAS